MKLLLVGVLLFTFASFNSVQSEVQCTVDANCNNGKCTNGNCTCNAGFVTYKATEYCKYQQKEKLTAFLLSFLIGTTGADWFYLAQGSGAYITAGVFKLLTGIAGIILPCAFCCLGFARSDKSKTIGFVCLTLTVVLCSMANGIWWLVDWIRILTGSFKDGNGVALKNW
jgi:TM2 domain